MVRWLIQPPQGLPRRSFGVSVVNAAREPVHFLGAGGRWQLSYPLIFSSEHRDGSERSRHIRMPRRWPTALNSAPVPLAGAFRRAALHLLFDLHPK
jgi:hypothetical protein